MTESEKLTIEKKKKSVLRYIIRAMKLKGGKLLMGKKDDVEVYVYRVKNTDTKILEFSMTENGENVDVVYKAPISLKTIIK